MKTYHKEGVASGRNETSSGRVLESKQAKDGARAVIVNTGSPLLLHNCYLLIEEGVEASKLSKRLNARDGNNGTAVRLLGPVELEALGKGVLALELGRGIDIVLDDLELSLDDVFARAAVDLTQRVLGLVTLVAQDEDAGRLGKPVDEEELDDRWDDAKSDCLDQHMYQGWEFGTHTGRASRCWA